MVSEASPITFVVDRVILRKGSEWRKIRHIYLTDDDERWFHQIHAKQQDQRTFARQADLVWMTNDILHSRKAVSSVRSSNCRSEFEGFSWSERRWTDDQNVLYRQSQRNSRTMAMTLGPEWPAIPAIRQISNNCSRYSSKTVAAWVIFTNCCSDFVTFLTSSFDFRFVSMTVPTYVKRGIEFILIFSTTGVPKLKLYKSTTTNWV